MASDRYVTNTTFKTEIMKIQELIINSEVKILAELQNMREDNEAHKFSHIRIDEEIEELQKKVGVA